MKKYFVSYDIAKALKDIKFDEPCVNLYRAEGYDPSVVTIKFFTIDQHWGNSLTGLSPRYGDRIDENECLAPMFAQVLDWLRDKHNLHIVAEPKTSYPDGMVGDEYYCQIYHNCNFVEDDGVRGYYETLEFGIKKAIELIKQ